MREPARCEVTLHPSRRLCAVTAAGYGLACLAVLLLQPSVPGAALSMLVAASGYRYCRGRFAIESAARVQGLRFDQRGWAVQLGGTWQGATVLSPVLCHRHLLVLRLRPATARLPIAVAITDDSCSAGDFRRLRVLARHLPAPRLWAASR